MVCDAAPLLLAKLIGVCCCRPRVTLRPAASLVVVSQMLTGSLAAAAGAAEPTRPIAVTTAATAIRASGRALDMRDSSCCCGVFGGTPVIPAGDHRVDFRGDHRGFHCHGGNTS